MLRETILLLPLFIFYLIILFVENFNKIKKGTLDRWDLLKNLGKTILYILLTIGALILSGILTDKIHRKSLYGHLDLRF